MAMAFCAVLLATLLLTPARSHGVDPGSAYPSASEVSDNKLGSVLIYNVISSNAASPSSRNTEVSITNHHDAQATAFRLFFVESATGVVSRSALILLAPNQVLLTLDGPPVSTPTRTATRTASAAATNPAPTSTRTPIVPLPTATRTATATPALAATATIGASATSTATATPTLTATATIGASATPTDAGPTATSTPTPTAPTPTGSVSPSPSPTEVPLSCAGDCNGNGVVAISELIIGVNITLRSQPLSACPTFDRNDTGTVTVGELIQGVNNLLNGCPILP